MTYQEQLESNEWKLRREEIIKRDNYKCCHCNINRSLLLNFSSKQGIKTKSEMEHLGFKIINNVINNSIRLFKNNNEIECVKLFNGRIKNENLNFAYQWIEPKNKFEFPKYRWVYFQKIENPTMYFDLNVHHKYYVKEKFAWEYDDSALITLCAKCHKEVHDSEEIPIYDKEMNLISIAENCYRCGGSGYLEEFNHYKGGICFECFGTGSKI